MSMNYGAMSESEMLMDLIGMDEWVIPEITADYNDDSWEKENWTRRKGKEQVPNSDLWQRLRELESIHSVSWLKVSGHAGVEENECCDKIATSCAKQFKE